MVWPMTDRNISSEIKFRGIKIHVIPKTGMLLIGDNWQFLSAIHQIPARYRTLNKEYFLIDKYTLIVTCDL